MYIACVYIYARAFENHCLVNLYAAGRCDSKLKPSRSIGMEVRTDRVSFHSLKGHRNAIVLSLENITGETIRDACVLVTRFARNGMTPLCKFEW